jgi:glucosamine-6-phosphate deaminase
MKLIVTEDSVGFLAASYVKQRIKSFNAARPFVLALPTGGTAVEMYKHLVKFYKEGSLSFKNVITFNLDEYLNFDATHPESYLSFMGRNFFDFVDVPAANIHIPNGNCADKAAYCKNYERRIKDAGGIDLFLGGVGANGHIAFNEPGSPFDGRTHVVELAPRTIKDNARFFSNDINAVPRRAITMGLGTVLESREIIIMATGQNKAEAVSRAVEGRPETAWPVTALQNHPCAYIVADKAAASEVSSATAQACGVCSFGAM